MMKTISSPRSHDIDHDDDDFLMENDSLDVNHQDDSRNLRSPLPNASELVDLYSQSPALFEGDDYEHDDSDFDISGRFRRNSDLESEYEYTHGLHTVPIHSPGEISEHEIVVEQRRHRSGSLRNRVFFSSDSDVPRRYHPNGKFLRRISFRRRQKGEDESFFWSGVLISNVLSFAVLICLVAYLAQTDFFASHQNELLGTTVDNRFTVVSEQDSKAKIFLKSGYSNSRFSESFISFGNGVMQLGRRALAATDMQNFYGVSLLNNGTAIFTNLLHAPSIETEYLHAGRAVIFQDGTTMTTAANISGGLKEVGDLNFASDKGSVIASAGGKQHFLINPDGTVVVANANAEDSIASGIVLDGPRQKIVIARELQLYHEEKRAGLSSKHHFTLATDRLLFGRKDDDVATITVPAQDEKNDDDATSLKIFGQESAGEKGGDIYVESGNGTTKGGHLYLSGGKVSTDLKFIKEYGSVFINTNLDDNSTSTTHLGSTKGMSHVHLHGMVTINEPQEGEDLLSRNSSRSRLEISGFAKVQGDIFEVKSDYIVLGDEANNESSLEIESNTVEIGLKSSSVKIGAYRARSTSFHGKKVFVDASKSISIGHKSAKISIGNAGAEDQAVIIHGAQIRLNASEELVLHSSSPKAFTTIYGSFQVASFSSKCVIESEVITLGGSSKSIGLNARQITLGNSRSESEIQVIGDSFQVDTDSISLGSSAATVDMVTQSIEISGKQGVRLGKNDTELISMIGKSITIGTTDTTNVTIGNSKSGVINLQGQVKLNGKSLTGRRLEMVQSEASSVFAILDAKDTKIENILLRKDFTMTFDKAFSSSDIILASSGDQEGFVVKEREESLHLGLTFDMSSVRFLPTNPDATSEVKIRCRLYLKYPITKVFEISGRISVCLDQESCHDEEEFSFMEGLHGSRIIYDAFASHDREYTMRCAINCSGSLWVGSMQLSVKKL